MEVVNPSQGGQWPLGVLMCAGLRRHVTADDGGESNPDGVFTQQGDDFNIFTGAGMMCCTVN